MRCLVLRLSIALLLSAFLLPRPVLAHKVNIFAYVDAGTVYVEGYFPDGRPVANGQVAVFDSGDLLLLEGQTDAEGLFQFALPKRDDLRLVLDASMGHKNSFILHKTAIKE